MSKHRKEGNNLHPLQKKIVLNLSKNGPQTINKTVTNMKTTMKMQSYKPTHTAFKSLEKKGILKKVRIQNYHGQQFPEFWLTEQGILTAFIEGAPLTDLLTQSREVYPNNQMLQYFLEIIPNFNPDIVKIALTALKNKGKLEPVDLGTIFFTQMDTNTTPDKFTNALETLKKYPKEHEHFKKQITLMQKNFTKLAKIIAENGKRARVQHNNNNKKKKHLG